METAGLTCPYCKHTEEIEIPTDKCLVLHRCGKCKKLLKPKKLCCVICEYSDKKCPVSTS